VSVVETVLGAIPQPYRDVAIRHRELVKFAIVGGTTWVIDTIVFLGLKAGVLETKPLTAKVLAVLVATIVSYVLQPGVVLPHPRRP
jgi:putative flippase GtrA